jgi:hypothetical protein
VQYGCANRLDVQPITLESRIRCMIAFIDRKADAGPLQRLRKAQAADSSANNQNSQRRGKNPIRGAHVPPAFFEAMRRRAS